MLELKVITDLIFCLKKPRKVFNCPDFIIYYVHINSFSAYNIRTTKALSIVVNIFFATHFLYPLVPKTTKPPRKKRSQ